VFKKKENSLPSNTIQEGMSTMGGKLGSGEKAMTPPVTQGMSAAMVEAALDSPSLC
jgi:hypothetical protein